MAEVVKNQVSRVNYLSINGVRPIQWLLIHPPLKLLARIWQVVKASASRGPLVRVSERPPAEQLDLERRNVERSLLYARDTLAL